MTHTEIIDRVFACMESTLKGNLDAFRERMYDLFESSGIARDAPDHIRLWAEYAFATYLKEHAENRLKESGNVMEVINFLKTIGK